MVLALTMIFLVIAVSLAGVLISSGSVGLQQSVNQIEAHQARLAAESGVGYLSALIHEIPLSGSENQYISLVSEGLNSAMIATTVYTQGSSLYVPSVTIENGEGGSFSAQISKSGDTFLLVVNGVSGGTSRTVTMEMAVGRNSNNSIFENGFLLGGKLTMSGNAKFVGLNNPSEAKVFTNYTAGNETFDFSGNDSLDGDLYAANSDGYASISGNVSIGGESAGNENIWNHVHFGEPPVELPRPDTSVFEPYATNTLSGSTNGKKTFTNIRIPANTNPHFSGNITFKGVVYIESPNKVTFSGNLDITGVIVTEDPGSGQSADNYLHFTGNTSAQGVENLPDEAQFAELRDMPGSAILAPGYEMKFSGNFGTVGGALAAEKFTLVGNAGGTVKGPVISYSDATFDMTGNAELTIDRSDYDKVPPGFTSGQIILTPVMNTYMELRE